MPKYIHKRNELGNVICWIEGGDLMVCCADEEGIFDTDKAVKVDSSNLYNPLKDKKLDRLRRQYKKILEVLGKE